MWLLYWPLLFATVTFGIALPAATIQRQDVASANHRPKADVLIEYDMLMTRANSHLLLPRPPAPYIYQLHKDSDLSIKFQSFGRELPKTNGNVIMYRIIHSVRQMIRDDPEHGQGTWNPIYMLHVEDEDGLTFMLEENPQAHITLGLLWEVLSGLSTFFREYGFVECRFQLLDQRTPGILAAGGSLKFV